MSDCSAPARVRPMRPSHADPRRRLAATTLVAVFALVASVALVAPGHAQHDGDLGNAPPPPAGPGTLVVQLVAGAGAAADSLGGRAVALYALSPDGTPGLANAETDASGRATFAGISPDPSIVYLIGARYDEIPFGERVTFADGEETARVEIRVSSPTDRVEDVRIVELRARIDWMGDRLLVTEILRVESGGDRVIRRPVDAGAAILERPLPAAARDFDAGPSSLGDELVLVDGRVRFYGPLYPGDQRIEYRYALPLEEAARSATLPVELGAATERVVVVAGTPGLEVEGAGLVASRDLGDDDGQTLASWARGALGAKERVVVRLALPETRRDPDAIAIPRADVWIDHDDTRIDANVNLTLVVDPGPPVAGTAEAPLLRVTLPRGATLQGVAPEAEALNLLANRDGGFDVIGPIGAGEHALSFGWRRPSATEGVALDLRFPRAVQTLNVLIADTGLALDSERLHRRRPFRNGTRNYLHREAYNVEADEVVDLRLEPLRSTGLPRQASIALTVAAAAAAALFLIAPLRRAPEQATTDEDALARVRAEREAIYSAIADLDHDFETGKLEPADHATLRAELRDEAIALLRTEQAMAKGDDAAADDEREAGAAATIATTPAPAASDAPGAAAGGSVATGGFCPSCGGRVAAAWRFCSHCGGPLTPSGSDG